jgi:hypothetical protein
MRDPFANYDAWLEQPYQDMIEASDRFVDWAEEHGYDFDDPEDMKQAELDYDAWLYDCEEAKAEAQYEAYLDRLEMEAEEREWDDRW